MIISMTYIATSGTTSYFFIVKMCYQFHQCHVVQLLVIACV